MFLTVREQVPAIERQHPRADIGRHFNQPLGGEVLDRLANGGTRDAVGGAEFVFDGQGVARREFARYDARPDDTRDLRAHRAHRDLTLEHFLSRGSLTRP